MVKTFWKYTISFTKWYMKKSVLGMPQGVLWTMGICLGVGILITCFDFLASKILAKFVIVLIYIMLLFASLFASDKWIRRFTNDKFKSPIESLKNFSNGSYLYGLLFWIGTGQIIVFAIIYILIEVEISYTVYTIINIMGFTFLWFTYHIYINGEMGSEEFKLSVIKLKLQLFAAIASSVSVFFLIFDAWKELKIMVTCIALVFTWLRYIIDAEMQVATNMEIYDGREE